jgi:hypothetical protein
MAVLTEEDEETLKTQINGKEKGSETEKDSPSNIS